MEQLDPRDRADLIAVGNEHPRGLLGLINGLWHRLDGIERRNVISFLLSGQLSGHYLIFPFVLSHSSLYNRRGDMWCDGCKEKLVYRVIESNCEPIYCISTGETCSKYRDFMSITISTCPSYNLLTSFAIVIDWVMTPAAPAVIRSLVGPVEADILVNEYRLRKNLCCVQCLDQKPASCYLNTDTLLEYTRDRDHPTCHGWDYVIKILDAQDDMVEAVVHGQPMVS